MIDVITHTLEFIFEGVNDLLLSSTLCTPFKKPRLDVSHVSKTPITDLSVPEIHPSGIARPEAWNEIKRQ